VVLQGVHRFWFPLARFCRELEFSLGHPTQVNAYVTPPGSQGFGVHEDSHDVFVLQGFGSKHWEVFEPAASAHRSDAPAISVELLPGDSLYIPKGAPHSARTQDSVSGHLTVGVLTYTWTDVLQELFRLAEEEDTFTERLPPGYHGDEAAFSSAVSEKLEEFGRWVEKVEPNDLAGAMVRKFLTSRPSMMTGSLEGLVAADRITDQTVLRRRPHSICHLRVAGDRLSAFLGDRELEMPASLLPAMNLVVDQERFQVSDLSPWLDEASRLVLSRRLIREGLLEAESVA
ncbi:MAG TPA: cupin domain-containing protein, partial [Actinomycetota bacterium]